MTDIISNLNSTDCIVSEYISTENTDNTENTENIDTEKKDENKDVNEIKSNFIGGKSSNIEDKTNIRENLNNKSELEKLIYILKQGIIKNEPGIKYIKYPNLLVEALEKLNTTIGMHRLKESVAVQTVRLIENLKAGEKSP